MDLNWHKHRECHLLLVSIREFSRRCWNSATHVWVANATFFSREMTLARDISSQHRSVLQTFPTGHSHGDPSEVLSDF